MTVTTREKILFRIHWRIKGGRRWCAPPTGSNSFVFVYVFVKKRPLRRSAPPPPPTGNPGSATGIGHWRKINAHLSRVGRHSCSKKLGANTSSLGKTHFTAVQWYTPAYTFDVTLSLFASFITNNIWEVVRPSG